MGSRDHSIECGHCGESYGGMNAETEEHECDQRNIVWDENGPRRRAYGECFCYAFFAGECACGGWDEADEPETRRRNALPFLAQNIATAAALTKSFLDGYDAGWGASGEGHNGEYTSKRFTEDKYVQARMSALTKEYAS